MAFDFPASPTIGQVYPVTPPPNVAQYMWDGEKWVGIDYGGVEGDTAKFVDVTGDTMTGNLTIASANPQLRLNKTADLGYSDILGQLNDKSRWMVRVGDGAAESGANNGSNFSIDHFNDAGVHQGQAFSINRASGRVNALKGRLMVRGTAAQQPSIALNSDDGWIWSMFNDSTGKLAWGGADVAGAPSSNLMQLDNGANLKANGYVTAGGSLVAGTHVISNNGRVLAQSTNPAEQPSIGLHSQGRSTAMGMWNNTDNVLGFGSVDGSGNPNGTWATLSNGVFNVNGTTVGSNIVAGNDVTAKGTLRSDHGTVAAGPYEVPCVGTNPIFGHTTRGNPSWNWVTTMAIHYSGNWAGWAVDLTGSCTYELRGAGQAFSLGGGMWQNNSDARIKDVVGDYTSGLDAICALNPVRYKYKGNHTVEAPSHWPTTYTDEQKAAEPTPLGEPTAPYRNSAEYGAATSGQEFIGLLAQEAELSMPELVSKEKGHIDGVAVDDLRTMNGTPIVYALVNAVKELKAINEALMARVETLERG